MAYGLLLFLEFLSGLVWIKHGVRVQNISTRSTHRPLLYYKSPLHIQKELCLAQEEFGSHSQSAFSAVPPRLSFETGSPLCPQPNFLPSYGCPRSSTTLTWSKRSCRVHLAQAGVCTRTVTGNHSATCAFSLCPFYLAFGGS